MRPLVVFLDDLQWADSATLNLLKLLITRLDMQYLFLIGAYRDNEVEPGHPLLLALAELQATDLMINRIALGPLDLSHIAALTADTLHSTATTVESLARLVLDKTGGNPFFVNEFLKSLYQENLLSFAIDAGTWIWDLSH